MVLVEALRKVLRPLTLSIRLRANLLAGHLLLCLLSLLISSLRLPLLDYPVCLGDPRRSSTMVCVLSVSKDVFCCLLVSFKELLWYFLLLSVLYLSTMFYWLSKESLLDYPLRI